MSTGSAKVISAETIHAGDAIHAADAIESPMASEAVDFSETQLADSDKQSPTKPATLAETAASALRERTERVARDINAKIDSLEARINSVAEAFERPQQLIRNAVDELRDRVSGLAHDVEQRFSRHQSEIADNKAELQSSQQKIEASQQKIESNQAEISANKAEIEASKVANAANQRQISANQAAIASLQSSHDARHVQTGAEIARLDQVHALLRADLGALSEEHDLTVTNVSAVAERSYANEVQLQEHKRLSREQVRRLSVGLVASSALLIGAFSYFTLKPIAAPELVNSKLETLTTGASEQRALNGEFSQQLGALDSSVAGLQGEMAQYQNGANELRSQQAGLATTQQTSQAEIAALRGQIVDLEKTIAGLQQNARALAAASQAQSTPLQLRDANWFAGVPSSHYVIQLASSSSEASLAAFASHHAISLRSQPLAIVGSQQNGRVWNFLTFGNFNTEAQAQAALAALPQSLRQNQPWIRQISTMPVAAR
ncbi:Hypothetical protein HDN1F_28880 [gamma proteobacterium HdN1]|nr:Hypothetical protein HDN1F_28880 [gamma proteobacterium HdN1]